MFWMAALRGVVFAFHFYSLLSLGSTSHLVVLTGHTRELYGEYIQEIMWLFRRSAMTSAIPIQAAAEIGY